MVFISPRKVKTRSIHLSQVISRILAKDTMESRPRAPLTPRSALAAIGLNYPRPSPLQWLDVPSSSTAMVPAGRDRPRSRHDVSIGDDDFELSREHGLAEARLT